jgi:hypothetical protein
MATTLNPKINSVSAQKAATKSSNTAASVAASTPNKFYTIPGYGTVTGDQYKSAYAKANAQQRAALDTAIGYNTKTSDESGGRDDLDGLQREVNPDVWVMGEGGVGRPKNDPNQVVKKADISTVGSTIGKPQNAQALARAFGVDPALFISGKLTIGKLANGQFSAIDTATGNPVGSSATQAQVSSAQKTSATPTVGVGNIANPQMVDPNAANKGVKEESQGAQTLSDYGIQVTPGRTQTQNVTTSQASNVDWGKIGEVISRGVENGDPKTEDNVAAQAARLESSGHPEEAKKLRDMLAKSKEIVKKKKEDANNEGALENVDDEEQKKRIEQQQDVSRREDEQLQNDFDKKRKELEDRQEELVNKISPMFAEQWSDIRTMQSNIDSWRSENRKLSDENYELNKGYLSKAEAMDSAAATNRLGELGASEEIMRNSLNQIANDPKRMASRIQVQEQYMNSLNSAIDKVTSVYNTIISRKADLTDKERSFAQGLKDYADTLTVEKDKLTTQATQNQFAPIKTAVDTQVKTTTEKATAEAKNKEDMVRYKDGDLQMRQSMLQDKLYTLIPALRGRIPEIELRRIANRNGNLAEDLQALSHYGTTAEDQQKLAEFGKAYGGSSSSSSSTSSSGNGKTVADMNTTTGRKATAEEIAKGLSIEDINKELTKAKTDEEKNTLNRAISIKNSEKLKSTDGGNKTDAGIEAKTPGSVPLGTANALAGKTDPVSDYERKNNTFNAELPKSFTELANMQKPTQIEAQRGTYILNFIKQKTAGLDPATRDSQTKTVISQLSPADRSAVAKVGGRDAGWINNPGFLGGFGLKQEELRDPNAYIAKK